MPLNTLTELLIGQLNELHAAESHSGEVLHDLARSATEPRLAELLDAHSKASRDHIARLRSAFQALGIVPRPKERAETEGMRGLCEDCMRLIGMSKAEPRVRDAAIIAVAQHLIHDEIAGYGCARSWAGLLGHDRIAVQLHTTLRDERSADLSLTHLAENINKAALAQVPT